jgi:hypothetical protein
MVTHVNRLNFQNVPWFVTQQYFSFIRGLEIPLLVSDGRSNVVYYWYSNNILCLSGRNFLFSLGA